MHNHAGAERVPAQQGSPGEREQLKWALLGYIHRNIDAQARAQDEDKVNEARWGAVRGLHNLLMLESRAEGQFDKGGEQADHSASADDPGESHPSSS